MNLPSIVGPAASHQRSWAGVRAYTALYRLISAALPRPPGGRLPLNSLRRLLTNILYTGAIQLRGKPCPGEQAAILAPGTWERVQNLITPREAFARGRLRNKHLALLSGLLYCESCAIPMVYSYSGKNDRRYPYYVCLNAQPPSLV
jgi:hypothetical protein